MFEAFYHSQPISQYVVEWFVFLLIPYVALWWNDLEYCTQLPELSQLLGKEVFWKDEVCCTGQFKEVAIPGKYLLVVLNIL